MARYMRFSKSIDSKLCWRNSKAITGTVLSSYDLMDRLS